MKKNAQEMILLYNFADESRMEKIKSLLEEMNIKVVTAKVEEHYQKIGYLFGLTGFGAGKPTDEEFSFAYELMMFHNFSKNRLDNVLKAMRNNEIEVPICKAVVTSFNRFWNIARVCSALEKEHLAMKKEQ